MPVSQEATSHPLLDELRASLRHVLTVLEQKWNEENLVLREETSVHRSRAERSFRLQGPRDVDVGIRFGVYPLGDGTNEVYVEVEDGPTCRFTYDPGRRGAQAEQARLGRTVTERLLDEIEPRIGQVPVAEARPEAPTSDPHVVLDADGRIQHLNTAARRALDYLPDESYDPNFFAHVHGRNLRRVMRDLARMVRHDLRRARWLVRLQTGADRWRWFRVRVSNRLAEAGEIRLRLHPVGQMQAHA
jgi:PAS domain-containing protein